MAKGVAACASEWHLNYAGGFAETAAELADYEKAGLDIVFVPEAYSFDAVSQLGYLAAKTERVELASGILQLYSRTPTLTAMTAAGLDYVSGGRFVLGIGASGPQVIEGWHGVPYDAPIGRTREIIEICRAVWRRERLEHDGQHYTDPAAAGPGHRAGQAAQADQPPGARPDPDRRWPRSARRTSRMAAELAEGWEPIFYLPGEGRRRLGRRRSPPARPGATRRCPPLDVIAQAALAIGDGDDTAACATCPARCWRSTSAAWAPAAGTSTTTWPSGTATSKEAAAIQDAYLDGRKDEAAGLVPRRAAGGHVSLIGPRSLVAERVAAMRESGVTTLNVAPLAATHAERVALIEQIKDLAA